MNATEVFLVCPIGDVLFVGKLIRAVPEVDSGPARLGFESIQIGVDVNKFDDEFCETKEAVRRVAVIYFKLDQRSSKVNSFNLAD